jgi:multicomponent Na+:H+ antiporter subunit C
MSAGLVYAIAGALLFCLGAYALIVHAHVLRKVLAVNVMASGTFLAFVGLAQRTAADGPDPVPHALVLTGIVVAVSASALALVLVRRLFEASGRTALEEDSAP